MTILDRALRIGEGKQFKQFAKRVERINAFEPELELLDDDGAARRRSTRCASAPRNGESLDELLPESFALVREAARRDARACATSTSSSSAAWCCTAARSPR